ncbi:MAG TPA: hypothetical protein VHV08_09120 [Pirellulales bacterium]|nr:hypothetical protein [Pirellulales bacterium]
MPRDYSLRSMAWGFMAVMAVAAGPAVANDAPVSAPSAVSSQGLASPQRISTLVRQLGDSSFSERQRASRELIAIGIAAQDALAAAANDPDAEIRSRARAVLAAVSESDFRDRLEAFSADYDGSQKQSLPGWERFATQMGTSRLARQLFVEMQRCEPELLAAYGKDGKAASDVLDVRCHALLDQLGQLSSGDGPVSLGTLASLLLLGSADDVTVDEQLAFQLFTWLIYRPAFRESATSGAWSPMMKKLLGMWIVKDSSPAATAQNLIFAANYELKPEGLSLANKLLATDGTSPQIRQFALLSIGRFGSKEQLPAVEKFLTDANNCGAIQVPRPPRQLEVQVRDVALAVLVHLSGQAVRDYGTPLEPNPQSYFRVPALAFSSPAARETALAHWRHWRAEHAQP